MKNKELPTDSPFQAIKIAQIKRKKAYLIQP
jgi:hypothetical protein